VSDTAQLPRPPESSPALLRRYLAIPPTERLKIVEANLSIMLQAMVKEDPGEVGVRISLPAVLADVIREIRLIKVHLGLVSAEDSKPPMSESVESSPVLRVEQLDLSEANL